MLLERNPELEKPAKRSRTLTVSVLIHVVLLAIVILDPGLFDSTFKRVIRIEGNDYDQPLKLTELELQPPPRLEPKPVDKPLTEPPPVVQPTSPPPEAAPPPPPPPPPPPTPPPQPHIIRPDDVIAPGARPDGQSQASRGSTPEPLRQGGGPGDGGGPGGRPTPQPGPPQRGDIHTQPAPAPPQVAQNTNPNAMTLPDLAKAASRIADQAIRAQQRGGAGGSSTMGAKTGRADAPSGQNFSADGSYQILSDTKGYDFGTYMNAVLNKVRTNWLIPDIAQYGRRGRVIIDFTILKSGDIADCHIVSASGERALDGSAKSAIDTSNPFQKLPSGFSGNDLQLRFAFYYNISVE